MRFRSLDGLRGLGALAVLNYHIINSSHEWREGTMGMEWLWLTPLKMIVAGPQAVIIFFVVSGFVLANSCQTLRYETYAFIRFTRLYFPFAIAIIFSVVLTFFLGKLPIPQGLEGLNSAPELTFHDIGRQLAMTGTLYSLDPPQWSLVQEIRISLALPFLIPSLMMHPRVMTLMISLGAAMAILAHRELLIYGGLASFCNTLLYVVYFSLGAALWLNLNRARSVIEALSPIGKLAVLAISIACLYWMPQGGAPVSSVPGAAVFLLNGIGAGGIVVLLLTAWGRMLEGSAVQYLGRISYSLYLTHFLVLVAVARILGEHLPTTAIVLIAFLACFPVAHLFHAAVEQPCHRLSRARWSRSGALKVASL